MTQGRPPLEAGSLQNMPDIAALVLSENPPKRIPRSQQQLFWCDTLATSSHQGVHPSCFLRHLVRAGQKMRRNTERNTGDVELSLD